MIDELRERGVSVLLATQYLDEAERLSDDIVVLRDGRVVAQGTAGMLRRRFGAPACRLGLDASTPPGIARRSFFQRFSTAPPMTFRLMP